tara:strand:- start:34 stop:321 length:288 start_codon:yes stop_codon:yes gene_type:complete
MLNNKDLNTCIQVQKLAKMSIKSFKNLQKVRNSIPICTFLDPLMCNNCCLEMIASKPKAAAPADGRPNARKMRPGLKVDGMEDFNPDLNAQVISR